MHTIARAALLALFVVAPVAAGCSANGEEDGIDDSDYEPENELGVDEGALSSAISCDRERQVAYQGGRNLGTMDVVKIGGKRVTLKTGHAFIKLQKLAHAQGVDVWINSGFRTNAEQQYFYNCYRNGNCNNGNLAARPGFSNHQHGRALDLGTSNRSKLNRIIRENGLDWRLTVPSEAWHYEYFGPNVSGPCDGNGGGTDDDDDTDTGSTTSGCFSPTLGRRVDNKVCVQGSAERVWFQCKDGSWDRGVTNGTGPHGACTASHGL